MAEKYPSKYSNGKLVSAAQYITEIICEKKASIDKKDLHFRFWLSKEWSAFFRNQIASANKLIRLYGEKAVIRALYNPKASRIFSLRAPHLIQIIEYEQQKLLSENQELSINLDRSEKKNFRQNNIKKNILSKLKDIDNGT
jgi:hypothetical protein